MGNIYREYERRAMEALERGDWDAAIEFGRRVPASWDIWQRFPSAALGPEGDGPGMPDHAIEKILSIIENDRRHRNNKVSFLYELGHNLPKTTSSKTLNRVAHALVDIGEYSVQENLKKHPNWKLDDANRLVQNVADFWREYEKQVQPHHFATVRSFYTGKTDPFTDHRKNTGEPRMDLLEHIPAYAKKAQDAILRAWEEERDIPDLEEPIEIKWGPKGQMVRVYRGVAGDYAGAIRNALGYRVDPYKEDWPEPEPGEFRVDHPGIGRARYFNKILTIPTTHLTSWTLSPRVARQFAASRELNPEQASGQGVVISHWVPLKNVLHWGEKQATLEDEPVHPRERELIVGIPDGKIRVGAKDLEFHFPPKDGPAADYFFHRGVLNRRPGRTPVKSVGLAKSLGEDKLEQSPEDQPLNCHPDALHIAEAILRGFEAEQVEPVKLDGRYARGTFLVRDPADGGAWLLKQANLQSPAEGLDQDDASQAVREACFYQVGSLLGLKDSLNETGLLIIGDQEIAAMRLIPWGWENMEDVRQAEGPQGCQRILRPALSSGLLYQWAALDYVLGNPDRHAGNMMTDGEWVVLIDHGSALAGDEFDPNDSNTFCPYYLRCWGASNFAKLSPKERYRMIPHPNDIQEEMLKVWVESLPVDSVRVKLESYGVDPKPFQARLATLRSQEKVGDYLCRWWAGLETERELKKSINGFGPEFWFRKSLEAPLEKTLQSENKLEPLVKMSTPAGLPVFESLRHRYENNTRRHLSDFGREFTPEERDLIERLKTTPISVTMPTYVIDKLKSDGRLKNLFETGLGMGSTDKSYRTGIEYRVLGIPYETEAEARPVYGALSVFHGTRHNYCGPSDAYGRVWLDLKPHVKERATLTVGDSFGVDQFAPVPATSPEALVANRRLQTQEADSPWFSLRRHLLGVEDLKTRGSSNLYIEAQIHGGVYLPRDVESINVLSGGYDTTDIDSAVQLGKRFGIPVWAHINTAPSFWMMPTEDQYERKLVFHPNQIKSATHNAGTYSPQDPDITKSEPLIKMSTRAGLGIFDAFVRPRADENRQLFDSIFERGTPGSTYGLDDFEKEYGQEPHPNFVQALYNAPISVHFPLHAIDGILQDGRLKNQFETTWSEGSYDPDFRRKIEHRLFNLSPDEDYDVRPVYGALDPFHDQPKTEFFHKGPAAGYGPVWFRLKPEVKARSTFTPWDSFNVEDTPHYVHSIEGIHHLARIAAQQDFSGKDLHDYFANPWTTPLPRFYNYIEAQIHGGVYLPEDVAEIHIGSRVKRAAVKDSDGYWAPPTPEYLAAVQQKLVDAAKRWGVKLIKHNENGLTAEVLYDPSPKPLAKARSSKPHQMTREMTVEVYRGAQDHSEDGYWFTDDPDQAAYHGPVGRYRLTLRNVLHVDGQDPKIEGLDGYGDNLGLRDYILQNGGYAAVFTNLEGRGKNYYLADHGVHTIEPLDVPETSPDDSYDFGY